MQFLAGRICLFIMRLWIFNLGLLLVMGLSPSHCAWGSFQSGVTPSTHDYREIEDEPQESKEELAEEETSPKKPDPNDCVPGDPNNTFETNTLQSAETPYDTPGVFPSFQMGVLNKRTEVTISSKNELTLHDVFYVQGKAHHCSMPRKLSEDEVIQLLHEKTLSDTKLTLAQAQALRDVAKKLQDQTKEEKTKKSLKELVPKFESLVTSRENANGSKPIPLVEPGRYSAGGTVSPKDNGYFLKTPSALNAFRGDFSDLPPGVDSATLIHGTGLLSTPSHSVTPTVRAGEVKLPFDTFGLFTSPPERPAAPPPPSDFSVNESPAPQEIRPSEPEAKAPTPPTPQEPKPLAKDITPPSQTTEPISPPNKTQSNPLAPEAPKPTISPKPGSTSTGGTAGETQEVVFEKNESHLGQNPAGIRSPDSPKQNILAGAALQGSDQEIPFGLKGPTFSRERGFEDFSTSRDLASSAEGASTVFPINQDQKLSQQKEAIAVNKNTFSYRKKDPSGSPAGSEITNGNGVAYSARNPEAGSGSSKLINNALSAEAPNPKYTSSNSAKSNSSDNFDTKSISQESSKNPRQGVKTATFWSPYSAESELPDGTGNLGELDTVLTDLAKAPENKSSTEEKGILDPAAVASNIQKIFESAEAPSKDPKTPFELDALKASNETDITAFTDSFLGERAPASKNPSERKTITPQSTQAGKRTSIWDKFLSYFRK